MQYVGDAVMAVFGAPEPLDGHEARALAAAAQMHVRQEALNAAWAGQGLPPFGLGIGLSTGQVAAALLGSHDRVEYTVVGDTVNLAARLCDAARPAGSTVASAATISDAHRRRLRAAARVASQGEGRPPSRRIDGHHPSPANQVGVQPNRSPPKALLVFLKSLRYPLRGMSCGDEIGCGCWPGQSRLHGAKMPLPATRPGTTNVTIYYWSIRR